MQQIYNILLILSITAALSLVSCARQEKVIPEKTMSKIVGEIYLADQYVENTPEYRAQMDSVYLYEAVTLKYGYTYAEYRNAIRYYLQKGDALKKIYTKAKDILTERRAEINALLEKEAAENISYWAVDSAKKREINNLWKEPYVRSIYWVTCCNDILENASWRFTDTTTYDTPQNALWWSNNIKLQEKGYVNSLYPILTRDYAIASNTPVMENKTSEDTDSDSVQQIENKSEVKAIENAVIKPALKDNKRVKERLKPNKGIRKQDRALPIDGASKDKGRKSLTIIEKK